MSVLLTDDDEIRQLNLQYRGQDKSTDVLSFAQSETAEGAPAAPRIPGMNEQLGDVVISVETAARQAGTHAVELDKELALLTVHGILHLLGYEDETVEGAGEMRILERRTLDFCYPEPAPEALD